MARKSNGNDRARQVLAQEAARIIVEQGIVQKTSLSADLKRRVNAIAALALLTQIATN